MTLDTWLHHAEATLRESGIESARLEVQVLAAHACGQSRAWVLAHGTDLAPVDALAPLLERRQNREPLAYIVGEREFFGRPFSVGLGALIPRQETESLVQATLDHAEAGNRVLELGVGSGCVVITLALESPRLRVYGCDVSPLAMSWAQKNRQRHRAPVEFVLCDWLSGFRPGAFDVIVSNPPYIASPEGLEPEVLNFEPSRALFASGNGLYFYRALARMPFGCKKLVLELGDGMADEVAGIFEQRDWKVVERRVDLLGHVRNLVLCPLLG